ncbi:MAG: hypothetical protein ABIN25_10940, partial [Ginsengibacter sp.]
MKKLFTLIFATILFATSFGQQENYKKPHSLGITFFLNDFQTAADLRTKGLVSVLEEGKLLDKDRISPGLAINYLTGISKHMDFIGTLGGSFVTYPLKNQLPSSSLNSFLTEANASLNIKLLSDKYWVTPFFDIGAGVSTYKKYVAAYIPVGTGLQVNLSDQVFLLINNQYRIPVTERAEYHLYHSITMASSIQTKKEPAPKAVEIPQITDRDSD